MFLPKNSEDIKIEKTDEKYERPKDNRKYKKLMKTITKKRRTFLGLIIKKEECLN